MYLFNLIHSKKLFKTLQQSFYIAQSQKIYCVQHSLGACSNPHRKLRLPPLMLTLYYLGEKLSGGVKNYEAAEYLSGGGIIIRACAGVPKTQKKNLTVSKTVAQYRIYPIPTLNTMLDLSISLHITKNTILKQCRNYTLS